MAQLIVTNLNDAGAGSLRQAVLDANATVGVADTIVFAGGLAGQTITLTTGELSLTDDVTIDGDVNGDNKADITISGNNASRIFLQTGAGTDVDLLSLTITNGKNTSPGYPKGGAIYTNGGTLDVFDTTISNSETNGTLAGSGGGICAYNSNTTLTNSLITSNTATGPFSGAGGGISATGGSLTLVNTTVDGNSSKGSAGGISVSETMLSIINSSITNNHADIGGTSQNPFAGGIHFFFTPNATSTIVNSVIADNTSGVIGFTVEKDVYGTVTTAANSVFGTAVTITNNTFSLTNVADIGLGALGNHGGTIATREILTGSVLINAGNNAGAAGILTDANGNPRISGGTVDIGASEYSILTVTNLNSSGAGSLSAAVAQANATVGTDHIVFQSGLEGTIHTTSILMLSNNVTINGDTDGDGDPNITIGSDGSNHRAFSVNNGAVNASLTSLAISGFNVATGTSVIDNLGTLTISYCNITTNNVSGGVASFNASRANTIANLGTLNLIQSVLSGNSQTGLNGAPPVSQYGNGLNGNYGGDAATIYNTGNLNVDHSAFISNVSTGGSGGNGGDAVGSFYSLFTGGNGGNGGNAASTITNGGTQSGTFGGNATNGTGGLGGMGGVGHYGAGGSSGTVGTGGTGLTASGGTGALTFSAMGDQFANTVANINSSFWGLGGDDILTTGRSANALYGGSGNDTLIWSSENFGSTELFGGLGDDKLDISLQGFFSPGTLDGGAGIDTLSFAVNTVAFGGNGVTVNLTTNTNVLLSLITGIENLIGTSVASDTLTGSAGNNTIQGLGGFDILDGGAGVDTLDYSEKTGNITLALNGATTVFQQLNGVNEDVISNFENIIGGSGADVLTGDITDNTFRGGLGGDTLNGGGNTAAGDTLSYEGSALGVKINLALNTAADGDAAGDFISNFENVSGSSQDDQLTCSTGVNKLLGGAGNDLLNGGLGADVLDGGSGTSDTADYRASTGTNIAVNLLLDTASGGHAAGDTLDNIENLFGSFTQRDILIGNTANNILKGFGGVDSLVGGDGDDFMEGGVDADAINGGAGIDTASYRDSNVGQVSINLLTATHSGGDAQGDTLFFIENLEGSLTRRDILIGNIVANRIIGNGGVDSIQGGDGNDFIDGRTGGDSLNAGAGIDTLSYEKSAAGVTVDLNVALQTSAGDANGDSLFFFENVNGSDFADNIKGNLVSNRLVGGIGADTLNGGTGSDYLTGGADADTFRFTDTAFGSDSILDWQDGSDKISMALSIADAFSDFSITGNATARAVIKIIGVPGSAITVNAAAPFTLDAGDFVFV